MITSTLRRLRRTGIAVAMLIAAAPMALAQQPHPAPKQAPAPQPPAPQPPPAQQQVQRSNLWGSLPKMIVERQFSGPLQDTLIQRLRDPVDGTICHLYLPISTPHSPVAASGFFEYGGNTIGSISCMPGPVPRIPVPHAAARQKVAKPAAPTAPPAARSR